MVKRRFFQTPPDDGLSLDAGNITRCSDRLKTALLREEISQATGFAQAFMQTMQVVSAPQEAGKGDRIFIKTDTTRLSCHCGSTSINFYTVSRGEGKDHLSVECARCGDTWLTVPI